MRLNKSKTTYYIMDCPLIVGDENSGVMLELDSHFKLAGIRRWWSGLPLKSERKKNIPTPVEFEFEAFQCYQGPPQELDDLGIPVMSKRLINVLTEAGVDNIEFFPAILRNITTGQTYNYQVYNIIGLVAATDLEQSEYETYQKESPIADTSIHKLVLDESKTHNLLLFRLAEDVSAIVVHERIKKQIENAGIDTMEFIKLEDYVQL